MALNQDAKILRLAKICEFLESSGSIKSFEKILEKGGDIKSFEKILEKAGDINYVTPVGNPYGLTEQYRSKYTALHFAYKLSNLDLFKKLLHIGADFTKQNDKDQTVLHMMIKDPKKFNKSLDKQYIDAVLAAHINTNNFSNPYDKRGFSHFHIACMTDNATAVKFFLDNGVLVDDPVHLDTTLLPGCTSLHLAAMHANIKVAELLLAYGANIHATDANGMTILHVLIKSRIEIFDSTLRIDKQLQNQIKENETIINMLMENMSSNNDCLDHIGLSDFHVACVLQDTSAAQHLIDSVIDLDHSLNADSLLWPGYTALHFAAHVGLDNVEMLVKKGANFGKEDSAGISPLDICIERYKIEDVCRIMSLNADWANITLSDGETNLISFLRSSTSYNQFEKLIGSLIYDMNMFVPMESPLWPGFRPLHLVVRLTPMSTMFIRLCLKNGSDLSAQDSRGRTALHLAYRLKNVEVVDLILHHSHEIPNALDEDNLSHLHIVCAVSKTMDTFKKCVIDDSNVNAVYRGTSPILKVSPGSTPLHVCLVDSYSNDFYGHKIQELLKYSVDPNIKDAYGLTPIHWLLNTYPTNVMKINPLLVPLLKLVTNDCVAEKYGLSHLHVVCHLNDIEAAKRLLKNGADVNSVIRYTEQNSECPLVFLSRYDKQTPLSMISHRTPLAKLLVDHKADMIHALVSASAVTVAPKYSIIKVLYSSIELQTLLRREFGWTRMHLACYMIEDFELEDTVREEREDVNAKVYSNSPFWKECTPLHLLMRKIRIEHMYHLSELLLDIGADVTISDGEQNTPITMLFKYFSDYSDGMHAALLMKYHRDFQVNPVNSQGISHFHLACYLSDVDAVIGFLSHGVDVNRPIDYFSGWNPGCTPLHLASNVQIVDLLINHGADVNIEDLNGHTALYKAIKRDAFDENIIGRLNEGGADINGSNDKGETPFEVALSTRPLTMNQLTFFIRQGFIVNSCNPISGVGYIAIALCTYYRDKNLQQLILETIMKEKPTNIFGRTTLHYLVTRESPMPSLHYALLIQKVIDSGCDIDGQDHNGRTALHLAVELQCTRTIEALLMCGADINVSDVRGYTALSYASILSTSKYPGMFIVDVLTIHACRLVFLKLDLNHSNRAAASKAPDYLRDYATNQYFCQEIVTVEAMELGVRSMRLSDFLTKTGAVAAYRLLTELERSKIDQYFKFIHDDDSLGEMKSFLKLQYRKALKRSELYSSAICSLSSVLGFDLPYLCAENIIQYLRNSDLQNIISARIENEGTEMDVD